ncbi:MAG: LpxI family protein [Pseudolabrys sp.]
MSAAAASSDQGPLALICGGGSLPLAVADSVAARGRQVLLFPLHGAANAADFEGRPHLWLYLGQSNKFWRAARAANCRDVVFIGTIVRPAPWQIRIDFATLKLLPRVLAAFRGGDDHLLSSIARLVEQHGFRLLGAHEVAPEILMPEGMLGSIRVSERDRADIVLGLDYLHATGAYDVGQAVIVAGKHVLAVEAAEGTDAMLARVAEMRANGRLRAAPGSGVLVKAPKSGQDRRFDLPSIGPQTVENVVRAGLAGIAVVAGSTILAEPAMLAKAADRVKIFIVGTAAER